MALYSAQLPNLMNGVSQQALTMRLSSQSEKQVNGFSSVVEGVNKRMPLKLLSKLTSTPLNDVYVHTINRDLNERYVVIVGNGYVRVFDMDGNEKTVSYPNGTAYLSTTTPNATFRAVTVADYTFIVNTKKTVTTTASKSPKNASEAILFVRAANYNLTYKVKIDGVEKGTFTTADAYGTQPKVSIELSRDGIAASLSSNLGSGYTVTAYGSIIHIKKNNGTAFTIEATDSGGNSNLRAIAGRTQRFSDLPTVGSKDFIVKVTGVDGETIDDYYLKFVPDNPAASFDSGIWQETVAPDITIALDGASMPHSLVRQPDGSFELQQISWGTREAGDETTAPWPSFVGRQIKDVYFDRNRLCFLSDDNVSMSRTNEFFSFFPETVVTLLDTAPIDIAATGSKVSVLQYAVPFNKQVVVFSDQTQFVIKDEKLLASQPPGLREMTAYEIDSAAKPVAIGRTIFFGVKRGLYSSVYEYFLVPQTETTDAADVTKHVPTYIPANLFKLAASTSSDVILALTKDARNKVWVYKYYWQGEQKLQSSWSHWEFRPDAVVLNADFIGDTALFVIQYNDGVYLETMEVSEGIVDEYSDITVRLDRRIDETSTTVTYNAVDGLTQIVLPYTPNADTIRVVSRPSGVTPQGYASYVSADIVTVSGETLTVVGDYRFTKFFVGENYTFEYEFSKPLIRTAADTGGQASVVAGRLQLNRWNIVYDRTGYFRAAVKIGSDTYIYPFSGKVLGTTSATIGSASMERGVFSFRVNSRADRASITLINDSFLPSFFTAAEWEGRYERRTSRV